LQINDEESQIPLMFVHHHDLLSPLTADSHNQKSDFGSGWDIIMPNEWAQIIWIALVYSGARPIGQQELSLIHHETGLEIRAFQPSLATNHLLVGEFRFPQEYPDTDAGVAWAAKVESERLAYFSKCPPSKRPNYFLYGLSSPFRPLWNSMVRDWALQHDPSSASASPYRYDVLRDRRSLTTEILREHLHTLIPIRLSSRGNKGVMDDSTLIYLPTDKDLTAGKKIIAESRHSDRARIEERKMLKAKQPYRRGEVMVKLIEERAKNAEQAIIDDCDRKLLGALTSGSFQLSRACCTGKGFIAAGGLLTLLQQQPTKKPQQRSRRVLVRTVTSEYYHWASLQF
jgi:hypothetical protein